MTAMQTLSTQPYKGSRDFYPEEMRVRNYIFSVWKKVCQKYGYEEYDGPFLESYEIYVAKSGEEIVNNELYHFEDKGGRKLAVRPEMTPTLARMVAQKQKELVQPIRWFSMPNLWRYEKPQRGRLREHFQLNVDVFGIEGVEAEVELMSLAIDMMKEFGATTDMFQIRVGNRRLIEDVYAYIGIPKEKTLKTSKAIDKALKLSKEDFIKLLQESAELNQTHIEHLLAYLADPKPIMEKIITSSKGAQEVVELLNLAGTYGIKDYIKYDPYIMRGFDYYTGNVFEQYDLNPNNNRAMYGGGRYDDLVQIFSDEKLSGVGFGMGDVTLLLFLENWNLLPALSNETEYLVTTWPIDSNITIDEASKEKYLNKTIEITKALRNLNKNCIPWLDKNTKLDKQLKFADRKGIKKAIIVGENELIQNSLTIKDLTNKYQETISFDEFISKLK